MGTDEYKKALDAAEKELETLDAQASLIEQRRAQLQQTIGALQTLTKVSEQEERTLTETICIVVKAATEYISAAEVLKGVISMGGKFGGKNAIASVVTILSRLHKEGKLEREPGVVGGGYRWKYSGIPAIDFGIRHAAKKDSK
jgi:hypothetical protein